MQAEHAGQASSNYEWLCLLFANGQKYKHFCRRKQMFHELDTHHLEADCQTEIIFLVPKSGSRA